MDGVTILNAYKTLSGGSAVLLGFGIVIATISAVGGFVYLFESCDWKDRASAMFLLASAFCIGLGLHYIVEPVQYYEVTLDERVEWTEFTTRYEIEKVRGQILTVQEVKDD